MVLIFISCISSYVYLGWVIFSAQILCKYFIWNYKNCWAQPSYSDGIIMHFLQPSWQMYEIYFLKSGLSFCTNSYSVNHYNDVIMGVTASQITRVSMVYSTVCTGEDQRKYQSSTSLVFVRGIHRWPVNSPQQGPVTQKMFPSDDIMIPHE